MKKVKILQLIELILLVMIAIGLISFLSYVSQRSLQEGGRKDFSFVSGLNLKHIKNAKLKIQKEEDIPIGNIQDITLDFSSADIEVIRSEETFMRIKESTSIQLKEEDLFTVVNQNGKLIVSGGRRNRSFILFGFNQHKIELLLPAQYTGDLSLKTASGDIIVTDDLVVNKVTIRQSSGNFLAKKGIIAEEIETHLSSGNITIDTLECVAYHFNLSSGNLIINFLKGSGDIEARSGNISIKELLGKSYHIRSSSGNIRLSNVQGSGKIKTSSGNIEAAYKKIEEYSELSASSGNIAIWLVPEMNLDIYAKCSSGDIKSDIALVYKNKKKSEATGLLGKPPYAKLKANTSSGDILIH